jgi:sulfur carrier protein ThiS
MRLSVHLHTILQIQTPQGLVGHLEVDLPTGSTMADLIEHLEIKLDPDAMLLVVNGRLVDLEHKFQEGDTVNLMPAISGGTARS